MIVSSSSIPVSGKEIHEGTIKTSGEHTIFRMIKNTPFFYELTKNEFSDIAKEIIVHHLKEKTVVVIEKKKGDSIFFITNGAVKVSTHDTKTGAAIFLEHFEAGGFFGETSLLTGRLRSASVTTVSDAELLEIPREVYCKIGLKYPFAMRFLTDLCRRQDKKISTILKAANFERRSTERIQCKGKVIFQKHENEDNHKVIKVIMGHLVDISQEGISFKAHRNEFPGELAGVVNNEVKTKIIMEHNGGTEIKILGKIIDLEAETTKEGFSNFYLARMKILLIDRKDKEYLQKNNFIQKVKQ